MVAPFSEVGMIPQVSVIQSITEPLHRPHGDAGSLPTHLCDLLDQTSRNLYTTQQRRLADVLQIKSNQIKSNQIKIKSNQIKSNQNQIKSNQIYFSTTFNITFMCTLLQFKIYKSIMIVNV